MMLPWMSRATLFNLFSRTVPETDVSSNVPTSGLSNQTARSGGSSGCSLHQRHITSTLDQRREWVSRVQNAIGNIDIPFGNKLLREQIDKAQYDLKRLSKDHPGDNQRFYLSSLQALIKTLVSDITLPENISVLQTLADLGLGLDADWMICTINIPPQLLKQLLGNTRHETVLRLLGNLAKTMMCRADPDFMAILDRYLTPRQLQKTARELMSEMAQQRCPRLTKINQSLRISDGSAPYLITAIFESLDIRHGDLQTSQDFCQTITTALGSEFFILQLCMLEVNAQRHEKLILEALKKLDHQEREQLLVCAFILGQREFFKRLLAGALPTILNQTFNNGSNILHLMATALPSSYSNGELCRYHCLEAYLPRYDQLFEYLPARILANQQDHSGATPLLLLYRHHCAQLASTHLSGKDDSQLARTRRSALIKLTTSGHLIDCMKEHLDGKRPLNVNWFTEFLQLFKSLPPSTFKAVSLRSAEYSYGAQLRHPPPPRATQSLQPVINYFEHHTDVLRDEQQTLELIRLIHQNGLPVEYAAQVLRVVSPDMQKKLLEHLSATPDDRDSLFIERRCDLYYRNKFYPWHLIALGVGAGCALNPDRFYSECFLREVAEFNRKHPKETVPAMSGLWEAELINSGNIEIYGRSLAFPSAEVPQGYRRFKFLKQQPGSTEDWHDFVREQPQLDFFRTHKAELGLESTLLKPRGIYRLSNALNKLKACRLPDETLATIALEPDGSALLQVFDDEKNSQLYHHYPYETEGVAGLSVQASFEGLRLFARDAGRLWQHNFQAPDT
ncbi:hypothetical protein, partial [Endozoicomonas sp. SESOKO4]|uniref:hypothetical protein n=1 Tax=Endozoicomonas sp. SESOKO4 TaxID=2828745 RepID=UPI0021490436